MTYIPENLARPLDTALEGYTPGIDRAVRFLTIDQVDMLAEFYLHFRADLPPTLAQALELPEIAALVEALKPLAIADKKQRAKITDGTMPITPPSHGGFVNLTRVAEALAKVKP